MTKKKKNADKNKNHTNQTAHEHALTNLPVREAIGELRASWDNLAPEERGDKLQKLVNSGCSLRGISEGSGIPPTTIRRYFALVKPSTESSASLEHTPAKDPQTGDAKRARAAVLPMLPKTPAKTGVELVMNRKYPPQDPAQDSKAQRTITIASSSETGVKEASAVKDAADGQEVRTGEATAPKSLVDLYQLYRGPMTPERLQLVVEMAKSMERPKYRDARSMKRQGRPVPTTDPN